MGAPATKKCRPPDHIEEYMKKWYTCTVWPLIRDLFRMSCFKEGAVEEDPLEGRSYEEGRRDQSQMSQAQCS
jgi:hypothetical protein